MKKRISCFVLAAFLAVTTCFSGISSLVYANNQEDTEVTKIDFANDALRFYLSSHDYAATPNNDASATTYADYNYWENVLIYTDDTTSKTLKAAYDNRSNKGKTTFYNLFTVKGTFAVALDDSSLNNATKIVIPSGTEFPSYAYTSQTTTEKKAYVTTKDVTYVKRGDAWEKYATPTTEETNVTKIDFANDALRFYLSNSDYAAAPNNDASATTYADYNYWENVRIYTDDTTSKTLKAAYDNRSDKGKTTFYNLFTVKGTFAVAVDNSSLTNATKIVIPAGTEFPSYAYTSQTTAGRKAYVTTKDVTYVKRGDTWEVYAAPTTEDTSVTKIDFANDALRFYLSSHDYAAAPNNDASATTYTDYNYWENVRIYTDSTTSKTLKAAYDNRSDKGKTTFYNLFTVKGTFAVAVDNSSLTNATKIVIPVGTEFPSYSYTSQTTTGRKAYVTTEEVTYVKKGDAWEKYVAPTTEDTSVTKIDFANDALRFYLSEHDYAAAPNNDASATTYTDYNYWENVLIYTDDTTSKTLKTAYDNRSDKGKTTFYNLFTVKGTFAVAVDNSSLTNATKIVIPVGTEFPSYSYTSQTTTGKKAYVTTKEVTYVKNGDNWEEYVAPTTEDTEVTKIDFANDALRFYLSEHDYAAAPNNDASATTYTDYNYWENVLIYTDDTASKTLKAAYDNRSDKGKTTFYNLFTVKGTFAVAVDSSSLTNATKIVIPAGTEFPSYAYTSQTTSGKKAYVTTAEVIYVKSGNEWVQATGGGTIDDLTSTPAGGETVNLLQGGIYDFVTNYRKATSEQYCTKGDCFAPTGVTFSWSQVIGAAEYVLEISNSESMIAPKTYKSATNTLVVDDLQAGKTYFYRIKVKDGDNYENSSVFTFKTAQLPRTISIDGVSNTRDLGGYLTADDKYRVRQGMVYRGANLENITTKGKQEFLETYGIKTDLDIRGDKTRSPLGSAVNFVSAVGPQYIQIADEQYKDDLAKELRTFADSSNYPIYFHCQIGRDRTGTLAMLINALLGVSEEDIYMDYELSMFSQAGWADSTPVDDLVNRHFAEAVNYIKDYQSGTLQENAEAFVKNELGITQAEIDVIRDILLEEAGNVSSYDTEINKIQVRGGKLIVFPENMDYAFVTHTTQLADKLSDYNILSSIVLYKSESEKATLQEVYGGNAWYTDNSIAFDLAEGWDGTTIKKVAFLPGAALPAYHYTNGSDTVKSGFVLRQETVFTTNTSADVNTDWVAEDNSTPVRTNVLSIKSGHNAQIVTFYLSNTDYDGLATAGIGEKHTDYNYLDQIKIYTDETNYVTLKDAYQADAQKYYNMWGEANTYSISLKEEYFTSATRIVIPAGTVFPSSKYTNGAASKKAGFVLKEEMVFEKPASGNDWSVVDTSEPDDTTVTKLLSGHNASILTFYLSASDYEKANQRVGANHTDYNYLDTIKLYTDENNYKTLGEVCKEGGQILYNMWDRANTFSIELDPAFYADVVKVFVPAGTVFPSSAHTNNGEAYKYGYVTRKDNTFGKPANAVEGGEGYQWNSLNPAISYDTVVSKIQVRDASGKLFLFLNHHDYAEAGSSVRIGNQLDAGNILEKIEVSRKDGVTKKLSEIYSGEGYYNLWGEEGCIALDMVDGWDGTNVAKIVVQAGCEFPSYAYTSGAVYDKTFYKTKYETVFEATSYPEVGYDNVDFNKYMRIPSQPVGTTVVKATVLGAAEDMRLILTLSVQDYANADESEAGTSRIKDYNTFNFIELCSGSSKVALADAVNTEEVYYNLWGRAGTISYGLKPEYNVNSFDKIIVKSGCEFPACSYTQTDSLDKTAYTVGSQQTINLTTEKYKVRYYDTNRNLLYTDEVVSGTTLSLRKAPEKAGYVASWSGMAYTLMPAQDISYQLSYTKVVKDDKKPSDEGTEEQDSGEQNASGTDSPGTGDANGNQILYMLLIMALSVGVFALIIKKKRNMRTEK